MRIIEPIVITPDMMVAEDFNVAPDAAQLVVKTSQVFQVASLITNVPENDYPTWVSTATYVVGDRRMHNHRKWEAVGAVPAGVVPGSEVVTTETPAKWLDLGITNRWAMFDQKVGTKTKNPESIQITIYPRQRVDSVALFGVDAGSIYVRAVDPVLGIVYESDSSPVSTDGIDSWYEYLFGPIKLTEEFLLSDIPAGSFSSIQVTLTKVGGIAAIGTLVLGSATELGIAVYGSSLGIKDFSTKERDRFGNWEVVRRDYSDTADFDVRIDTAEVGRVRRTLAKYRATPIVYVGAPSYDFTMIYGYFTNFAINISGPVVSDATISIEGLN